MKYLLIVIGILLIYSGITTYKLINAKPEIVNHTDTIPGDIQYRDTIIYKPKPYIVEIPIYDTLYIPKDSAQCLADFKKLYKEYSTVRLYKDTAQNDSSMTIIVNSAVINNSLYSLKVNSKNNRVKVINTTIVTYKNKSPLFSVGVLSEFGTNTLIPFADYSFKKVDVLGGYNFTTKNVVFGLKFTILNK